MLEVVIVRVREDVRGWGLGVPVGFQDGSVSRGVPSVEHPRAPGEYNNCNVKMIYSNISLCQGKTRF